MIILIVRENRAYPECPENASPVPQWYVVPDGETIIAGLGVIENDFHDRKDLTPNVCAVYVEEACCQGIAGKMLQFVCADLQNMGIPAFGDTGTRRDCLFHFIT